MTVGRTLSGIFVGSEPLLARCAGRFLQRGHAVPFVVTDDAALRRWAADEGIAPLAPDESLHARLHGLEFDYLFSVTHLRRIPDEILALPREGAINFHDGPLPARAGLNAPAWALIEGAREHGISWHAMTSGIDTGDVLVRTSFPVDERDTALTLTVKCHEHGLRGFDELLERLAEGRLDGVPQDLRRRRYYAGCRRPPAAGSIDWARPARRIADLIRGLDFGPQPNPLTLPKLWLDERAYLVTACRPLPRPSTLPPGTVVALVDDALVVATGSDDLEVRGLKTLAGVPIADPTALAVRPGERLRRPRSLDDDVCAAALRRLAEDEPFWIDRLGAFRPVTSPSPRPSSGARPARSADARSSVAELPRDPASALGPADRLLAAVLVWLSRIGETRRFDVAYAGHRERLPRALETLLVERVPLRVELGRDDTLGDFLRALATELDTVRSRARYARDLLARVPRLSGLAGAGADAPAVAIERVPRLGPRDGTATPDRSPSTAAPDGSPTAALTLTIPDDGAALHWRYDTSIHGPADIRRLQTRLAAVLDELCAPDAARVPLRSRPADTAAVDDAPPRARAADDACVHRLFERQVERSPRAAALTCRGRSIDYATLNGRANRLAHRLVAEGVRPGDLVGVLMARSAELVIALLGVLKAGAAYVPLDPGYPSRRLAHMMRDAGLRTLVCDPERAGADGDVRAVVVPEPVDTRRDGRATTDPRLEVGGTDLAYVIYTSGSSGEPKGVMVEHRNVTGFFAAMDRHLDTDAPGVWLALTSVSFDISVLELLWTLTRGYEVVLHTGEEGRSAAPATAARSARRGVDFSLFYFASDEGEGAGADRYRLLMEGAKFADRHGFSAIWTPERHFHSFGGLFPNPSVTGAAVAAITERVGVRAGSCVLPLHDPIRVAEEWAVVDNLSGGRVGISFASGWQPDDFVLAPQRFEDRQSRLLDGIETVRALWRGERRRFAGPRGDVEIATLPRPVQAELPVWLTAAGNPATFEVAGRIGANLLTHLLGQDVDGLADRIRRYHAAWREHGHPGRGRVSLMLHTFVDDDEDFVHAQVREPLKGYLRSATHLIRQSASTFPAFRHASGEDIDRSFAELSAADLDALLEHAFERYYRGSGLFGSVERCLERVAELEAVGVDEIACLIDFGVPSAVVLEQLPALERLRRAAASASEGRHSIPALMREHRVTHLQCTPSQATLLVHDRRARDAFGGLRALLVGGETLPPALAAELHELTGGTVYNLYGPTEATVWSSLHRVDGSPGSVPIGRALDNTRVHVVDERSREVPPGAAGELVIGGAGVARGYLGRPELSAERFVADPFRPGARRYRTGDIGRRREDGTLEFLGRADQQVKVRGHRVELGEIESRLAEHERVAEAVVVARSERAGERPLFAYVVFRPGETPEAMELRTFLERTLPPFMLPARFVALDALPRTPNGKIDRRRLADGEPSPSPTAVAPGAAAAADTPTEETLKGVYRQVLRLEHVASEDGFAALGGDSLSAVRVFLEIRRIWRLELPLEVVLQSPDVRSLATVIDAELDDRERLSRTELAS